MGEISDIIVAMKDIAKEAHGSASAATAGVFKPYGTSISSMALQGTANFPVLVSDSLELDDAIMIANSLERKFATFLLTVMTMNPYLSADNQTPSAAEYLKQFHQNMGEHQSYQVDIPKAMANLGITEESVSAMEGISPDATKFILDQYDSTGINYDCWVTEAMQIVSAIYENVDYKLLNDKNISFNYTMEEVMDPSLLNNKAAVRVNSVLESKRGGSSSGRDPIVNNVNPQITVNPNITVTGNSTTERLSRPNQSTQKIYNHLADNDLKRANELVPTIFHMRVYPYKTNSDGSKTSLDPLDFIVGVKATLHAVPTAEMIANIANGLKNNNGFFNFIRWTTGETKFFKDFLFAIDQQKLDAKNTGRGGSGWWWSALKRRKASRDIRKSISKKSCLPNATLVCTVDDLDMLKSEYGFDLTTSDTSLVYTLMKQYFLLSFVRVNPALQRVDFLFDGNSQFETTTYSTLSKEGSQDGKKFKDMMKMLGRSA